MKKCETYYISVTRNKKINKKKQEQQQKENKNEIKIMECAR